MTAQEYLATIKRPLTDIERNCAIEAWDSAKKDCALECRKVLEKIKEQLADPWKGYSKAMVIIDRELEDKP